MKKHRIQIGVLFVILVISSLFLMKRAKGDETLKKQQQIQIRLIDGFGKLISDLSLFGNTFEIRRLCVYDSTQNVGLSRLPISQKERDLFYKDFEIAFNTRIEIQRPGFETYLLVKSNDEYKAISNQPQNPAPVVHFLNRALIIIASRQWYPVWTAKLVATLVKPNNGKPALNVALYRSDPALDGIDSVVSLEIIFAEKIDTSFAQKIPVWNLVEQIDKKTGMELIKKNSLMLPVNIRKFRWIMLKLRFFCQSKATRNPIIWELETRPTLIL